MNKAQIRIGFVGLGNIGKPMAERLARAHFALTVFDERREQMDDVVRVGAVAAESLEELANRSDLVEIVVRTPEQLREVVLGAQGILAGLARGAIIAVHSTVGRDALKEIAERCGERGVALLDAPMDGGASNAGDGTLTFIIGGDAAVLERCRPVFETLATSIFHFGDIGCGQAGKLVNNLMFGIGMVAAAECMRLAIAAGIPERSAAALLRSSTGSNQTTANWQSWMHKVHSEGALQRITAVMQKDNALGLALAEELNVRLPLSATAGQYVEWALGLTQEMGTA